MENRIFLGKCQFLIGNVRQKKRHGFSSHPSQVSVNSS
nr:MAG TPA: hypothetical protein [Bacteriophage sp.]